MDKAGLIRGLRNGVLILLLLTAMVWVKTYAEGRHYYQEGEKEYAQGNLKDAITDYETSIHMYTPLAGYVPKSAQRLWEIGQGFEGAGQFDWALIALRSLRSSFYAVRSFYTPYQDWIDRSEAEIEKCLAAEKQGTPKEAAPPAK